MLGLLDQGIAFRRTQAVNGRQSSKVPMYSGKGAALSISIPVASWGSGLTLRVGSLWILDGNQSAGDWMGLDRLEFSVKRARYIEVSRS